jgi:YVTN family beta-propeller protein
LITVGLNPLNAIYDSSDGDVYVTNQGSNTVSIINSTSNTVVKTLNVGTSPNFLVYDTAHQYVYVANSNTGNVSIIQGTGLVQTLSVGSTPQGPIYDALNERVYVPNQGSNTVTVLNGTSVVKASIPVGTSPAQGAFDMATGTVYVVNGGSSNVSVINVSSNTATSISVGSSPHSASYDPGNGQVYVANGGGSNVTAIPTGEPSTLSAAATGSSPKFVGVGSWNGYIYVANSGTNNITVFSPATNRPIANLSTSKTTTPWTVTSDSRNGCVYVTDSGSSSVTPICGLTVQSSITVGSTPEFATFDPTNGYIYVMNYGSSNITVINGATNHVVVSSIAVKSNPQNATFDPKDGYLFVADYSGGGAGYISVIKCSTNVDLKDVAVGSGPLNPTFDPTNGDVYVANSASYNVSVLNASNYNVVNTVPINTGTGPHSTLFDPVNRYIYVPSYGGGVAVIGSSNAVITALGAGVNPLFATFSPASGLVYVYNSGGSNVTVVNSTTVLGALPTGSAPLLGAYSPGSSDIYVPNTGSSNMSVLGYKGCTTLTHGCISIVGVSVLLQSSNTHSNNTATISFRLSPSGGTTQLIWGLNATFLGYESGFTNGTGTQTSFTLNYLNPGSTFWYEILVTPPPSDSYTMKSGFIGNFSTATTPTSHVTGYVVGPNDAPLSGATVTAVYSGFFCNAQSTTTATNGSYSLPATERGGLCSIQSWNASLNGYFTENWTIHSEPNSATGFNWQTFTLIPNQAPPTTQHNLYGGQNGVYAALVYVHNSNVSCTVNTGYSVNNSVYAYVAGSGFTDTQAFTMSNTFPGTGSPPDNGESLGVVETYSFSGSYSIDPIAQGIDQLESWAVGAPLAYNNVFVSGSDPVSSPPAVDGVHSVLVGVPAGNTANEGMKAIGTMTLQFGVQMTVSVGFSLGVTVSFGIPINFGVSGTTTSITGVSCVVGSTHSTSYQYFDIDSQGGTAAYQGVEFHVWQCQPRQAQQNPPSCVPMQ